MHEFHQYVMNDISELIQTLNKRESRFTKNQDYTYRKFADLSKKKWKKAEELFIYSNTTSNTTSAIKARKLSRIFNLVGKYYKQRSLAIPTVAQHKQKIRFSYFRYADDWILFTNGNKTLVKYIKNKVAAFFKYRLKLLALHKPKSQTFMLKMQNS